MKYILLVCSLIITSSAWAYSENMNAIENKLTTSSNEKKIPLLVELTNYYSKENPLKAKQLGLEAMALLEKHPSTKHRLSIGHNLVISYFNLGEFENASKLVYQNEKHALIKGDLYQKALVNKDIANLYMHEGDYKSAIKSFNKSCSTYKKLNNMHKFGMCLNDTGLMHSYDGNYDVAIEFYFNALDKKEYVKEIEATHVLGNIALVHMRYGRWDEALVYYHQALAHAETFSKDSWISEQVFNIGVAHLMNKEYEKAITYFNRASHLEKGIGNVISQYSIFKKLGGTYRMMGDYKKALKYYMQALDLALIMKSDLYFSQSQSSLGMLYSKLKQYDKSMFHLQKALSSAIKLDQKPLVIQAHQTVSDVYKHKNDYKNAYNHLAKHYQLKEERTKKSRLDKISELEEKYKAGQRDTKIKLLTKDKALEKLAFQQRINLGIGFIILTLMVLGLVVYRQIKKKKIAIERANLMKELVEKKNQLLADVSHELRTPLTVLQLKVEALQHNLVKDVDASYEGLMTKIGDINKLITDIYQLAQSDIGALELELSSNNCDLMLNNWALELSEIVQSKGFVWQQDFHLPENLSATFDKNKIKQVLNNLVNNSIAYTDTPGKIELSARVKGDKLEIRVMDSSPSVSKSDMSKIFERLYRVESSRSRATGGSGLGLSICKSIVETHNGTIRSSTSHLGGVSITIKLPLVNN